MVDARPPLSTFGLTHDPFINTTDDFFGGGDRARYLEELRELPNWPDRVAAVIGERGVGKTSLYRALSNSLGPRVKAARVNANLTSDTRAVLTAIIQGFGVAVPANSQPQLLTEFILLHVQEQIDLKRRCLVLVDDAHLLELSALERLLAIVDATVDDGLRVAFFAEGYFVQSLNTASSRTTHVQSWRELKLVPFTDEESRAYISFRLNQAGAAGRIPFTHAQLNLIVGGSSGLPGRINTFASAVLSGELLGGAEQRSFPRMHRALAVLILISAGMGWLIFRDLQVIMPPQTSEAAMIVPDDVDTTDADNTLAIPPRLPPVDEQEQPQEPAPAITEAATVAMTTQPAPVPEPASIEPASPPPPPAAKPVESTPVPKPNQARGKAWIKAQPATHYTLQLLAAAKREQRDKFLLQQEHPERFATFQTRRGGATWYALAYGSYKSRAEADAALAALPPDLSRLKPWVRTFASVQATLE